MVHRSQLKWNWDLFRSLEVISGFCNLRPIDINMRATYLFGGVMMWLVKDDFAQINVQTRPNTVFTTPALLCNIKWRRERAKWERQGRREIVQAEYSHHLWTQKCPISLHPQLLSGGAGHPVCSSVGTFCAGRAAGYARSDKDCQPFHYLCILANRGINLLTASYTVSY